MQTRVEGNQKSKNFADVIFVRGNFVSFGCVQSSLVFGEVVGGLFVGRGRPGSSRFLLDEQRGRRSRDRAPRRTRARSGLAAAAADVFSDRLLITLQIVDSRPFFKKTSSEKSSFEKKIFSSVVSLGVQVRNCANPTPFIFSTLLMSATTGFRFRVRQDERRGEDG